MGSIDNIVEEFLALAEDYDPEEVSNWREQTYEGIKEEQKNPALDIAEQVEPLPPTAPGRLGPHHTDRALQRVKEERISREIPWLISGAEEFLRMRARGENTASGFAASIAYLEDKVGDTNYKFPGTALETTKILINGTPSDLYSSFAKLLREMWADTVISSIRDLKEATIHAQNLLNIKGMRLSGKELSEGSPSVIDSARQWAKWHAYSVNDEVPGKLLAMIKLVENAHRKIKEMDKAVVPLFGIIKFLKAKTYGLNADKKKVMLPLVIPQELDFVFDDHLQTKGAYVVQDLVKVYHMLRSNAVQIINHTKSYWKEKSQLTIDETKRVKNKPKDFLPIKNIPAELRSYIFKLFRNKDDALAEIIRVQEYLWGMEGAWYFYFMYKEVTGKGYADWYRQYLYKDDTTVQKFSENWAVIDKNLKGMFSDGIIKGMKALCKENGNPQMIPGIISAAAAAGKIVHNFEEDIKYSTDLKEEIFEVIRNAKGGIFKFDIVPRYIYAKSRVKEDWRSEWRKEKTTQAIEAGLINEEEFLASVKAIKELRLINIERSDYDVIKKAETLLKTVSNSENILKYENTREDKNEFLFNMDSDFTFEDKKIEFKVLRDKDPLHFFIGLETDCCQTIGGAGEDAAIDSYINNNAGVVVMYVDGAIVAQSYFHYVPPTKEQTIQLENKDILFKRISDLNLSVRARLALTNQNDVLLIGELVQHDKNSLIRNKNIGRKILKNIEEALAKAGLRLGMQLSNWPENARDFSNDEIAKTSPTIEIEPPHQGHGIILDNVEAHPSRQKSNAISSKDLDTIYAKFAKEIADKLKLNYVKCGMEYNALNSKRFKKSKMGADPREFKSKEIYTDFSKQKHLDLLRPKAKKKDNNDAYAALNDIVRQFIRLSHEWHSTNLRSI